MELPDILWVNYWRDQSEFFNEHNKPILEFNSQNSNELENVIEVYHPYHNSENVQSEIWVTLIYHFWIHSDFIAEFFWTLF